MMNIRISTILVMIISTTMMVTVCGEWAKFHIEDRFLTENNLVQLNKDGQLIRGEVCGRSGWRLRFADLSWHHNAYVAVCESSPDQRLHVRIHPMNLGKRCELLADGTDLSKQLPAEGATGSASLVQHYYDFDYLNGLLYVSARKTIHVFDLKQPMPDEYLVYKTNGDNEINGMALQIHRRKLLWLEANPHVRFNVTLMEAPQNGFPSQHQQQLQLNVHGLQYDHVYDSFLLQYPLRKQNRREMLLVSGGYRRELTIDTEDVQLIKHVVNVGDKLYLLAVLDGHNQRTAAIYELQLRNNTANGFADDSQQQPLATSGTNKQPFIYTGELRTPLMADLPIWMEYFTLYDKRRQEPEKNLCETSECFTPGEFCIPINDTNVECTGSGIRGQRHWRITLVDVIIALLIMAILLAPAIYYWCYKTRKSDYKVKGKNLKQVGSFKAPPGAKEVAG